MGQVVGVAWGRLWVLASSRSPAWILLLSCWGGRSACRETRCRRRGGTEPALSDVASFGELLRRVRRLDVGSDEAMRALARLAAGGEPEVCLVVTAALLPLLIARCDRRRELVAEAVPELASRVSEPAGEDPAPGVANRLLRRVVWRVQHDHGRRDWQVPYSEPVGHDRPHGVSASVEAEVSFEEPTVDRLALVEFQRRLEGCPRGAERGG